TPGDCTGCTSPASTYQHDDFGNVVEATLPWTDNGSGSAGTTHYEYDAAGLLLRKQTPSMVSTGGYLEYAYDSMGRVLSLTYRYTTPSSGSVTLYTLAYDGGSTPHGSCPQPANTVGRLLYRNDSFGLIWYQ